MPPIHELEISLAQIEIDPDNVRTEYDPQIVAGLRNALQVEGGFINPPTVYPVDGNRYRVKHGSTRVLAAQGVAETIRVHVVEPPRTESTKLLSQMGENLLQGSLRPADVGTALKRLREADGKERSLSQLVGALKAAGIERTKSWVAMHLALAGLTPELQRLVNQGKIGAEVAYQLRSFPEPEQMEWALRIINEGITKEELRRRFGGETGDDSGDSTPPPEFVHRDLDMRLSEAAEAHNGDGTHRQRSLTDNAHRNSRAMARWELLPVAVADTDARKVKALNAADWAQKATAVEKQLAQEALFIGGYSAKGAVALVDRAIAEAQDASESVMAALNALRKLVEEPAELRPGSALAQFMVIRLNRVLHNLGAGPASHEAAK